MIDKNELEKLNSLYLEKKDSYDKKNSEFKSIALNINRLNKEIDSLENKKLQIEYSKVEYNDLKKVCKKLILLYIGLMIVGLPIFTSAITGFSSLFSVVTSNVIFSAALTLSFFISTHKFFNRYFNLHKFLNDNHLNIIDFEILKNKGKIKKLLEIEKQYQELLSVESKELNSISHRINTVSEYSINSIQSNINNNKDIKGKKVLNKKKNNNNNIN